MMEEGKQWFGVRHVVHHPARGVYEERITLWLAKSASEAIRLAETEAREEYAIDDEKVLDLFQSYNLFERPANGAEVFSLMRESSLAPDEYVDHFFSTGAEREEGLNPVADE